MLAQASNNAPLVGNWIFAATMVCQFLVLALQLWKGNSAQKREVSFVGECADKTEFDLHREENKGEFANLYKKIGGVERGIRGEIKSDLENVRHELQEIRQEFSAEMRAVTNNVASLKTATDLQNEQMSRIESAVHGTPRKP
jgi:predicted  nucleic acid-binding Zn-ribbon protein